MASKRTNHNPTISRMASVDSPYPKYLINVDSELYEE